jgi:oligopeptide transport system permease protein
MSTGAESRLSSLDPARFASPGGMEILTGDALEGPAGSQQRARDWAEEEITERKSLSPMQASMRRLARDKRAMGSLAVLIFMILLALVGPHVLTLFGPSIKGGALGTTIEPPSIYRGFTHQELANANAPSSSYYWLGADDVGRDILSRIMAGITVSLIVASLVVAFDIALGVLVGTLAGYYGGVIDTFLARFTDLMFAFPALLFAILAAATLGDAFDNRFGFAGRLVLVSLALGITAWPQMARYVRGQTLQLKEQQFVEAARAGGTSNGRIITRHILPNLLSIVITAATLDIATFIIAEATISLLGLGVQPPGSSLGLMIVEASTQIISYPMEVVWPSLALTILVIALSFLGDGINVAFNPRLKD